MQALTRTRLQALSDGHAAIVHAVAGVELTQLFRVFHNPTEAPGYMAPIIAHGMNAVTALIREGRLIQGDDRLFQATKRLRPRDLADVVAVQQTLGVPVGKGMSTGMKLTALTVSPRTIGDIVFPNYNDLYLDGVTAANTQTLRAPHFLFQGDTPEYG